MRFRVYFLIAVALGFLSVAWTPGQLSASTITVHAGSTIQDTINNASPGDTVQVPSGTYREMVLINKPLRLIGESQQNTIIDCPLPCPGAVVLVTSSNVEISRLNVQNSDVEGDGIRVRDVSKVNVTQNIISVTSDGDGVSLSSTNNSIITENLFEGSLGAIQVFGSFFNLISYNTGISDIVGVRLDGSENNTLAYNSLINGRTGIELVEAHNNTIVRNSVTGNSFSGVSLQNSHNNTLIENTLRSNDFGLDFQASEDNVLYHNNMIRNSPQVFHSTPEEVPLNKWHNGTAGNYWDDYSGLDDGSGGRVAGDGVGDTEIPHLAVDNYPLMKSVVPVPLEITAVSADPESGTVPLEVSFAAEVRGANLPLAYSWDFGDGEASAEEDPSHTYSSAGTFTVRVLVRDSTGTSDAASVTVEVEPVPQPSPPRPGLPWWAVGGVVLGIFGLLGLVLWRRRGRKVSGNLVRR